MDLLCDYPTYTLILYPILAQYMYPMHPNIKKTKRLTYKAQKTQMFVDIIPFDECRYIYDWLPSSSLLNNITNNKEKFMIFRLALDGLVKQILRYIDLLYGCNAMAINYEGFEEVIIEPRKSIL